MKQNKIKFIISQDGSVREEVIGAESGECIDITQPFEEALGLLDSREFKPEYYVTPQYGKNKATQETTIN